MPVKFATDATRVKTPVTEQFFDAYFHPTREGLLATTTIEGDVHLIDVRDGTLSLSLDNWHKGSSVRKVRFAGDNTLVTGAKTAKLYDLDAGRVIRKLGSGKDKIYSLAVIDHYLLATGHDSGTFNLWDYRTNNEPVLTVTECSEYISDLDVSENKRIVVATSGEGTLTAFNVRQRRMETPQSELFDSAFVSVSFLESRGKVLAGSEDGIISIFNNGQWGNICSRFPIKGSESINCLRSLAESVVLVGDDRGLTRAVNIEPNKVIKTIAKHESSIEAVAIQPSIGLIVSVDATTIYKSSFELCDEDANSSSNVVQDDFFADLQEKESGDGAGDEESDSDDDDSDDDQ